MVEPLPGGGMEIPGYTISGLIEETQHSAVYRGKKNDTGRPVIIKTIREISPGFSETARIRRETNSSES
ncbi:MAG: hypothetical protein ACOC8Q_02125 [Desulfosalsimonas sp.]